MRLRPSPKNDIIQLLQRWADDHRLSRLDPIFPGVDPAGPAGIFAAALRRLACWYRLGLQDPTSTLALYSKLQKCPEWVEEVCLVPYSPGPPTHGHSWVFPSGEARDQAFRGAAPRGVGADRVQHHGGPPGAGGEGVRLADIEHGWGLAQGRLWHPDLPQEPICYRGEANAALFADHGTRVLGILLGLHQDPPVDVRGLAPNSLPILLLGNLQPGPRRQDIQTTDTRLGEALQLLSPGDVVLIEAQTRAVMGGALLPAQTDAPVADAIRACVAKGIAVVAAAGNGGQRSEVQEDPGSILVAGGQWVQGGWLRCSRSNYGPDIHCFAEGERVTTAALPPPGQDAPFRVTTAFSGTSAAAAIIAGVAASVQGMARALRGAPLHPAALRDLLSHPELSTAATPGQEIGRMPDLERLAGALPLLPSNALLEGLFHTNAESQGHGNRLPAF